MVGVIFCTHWHQYWELLFQPLTPMPGVIIASTDTKAGGYFCIHLHQCLVLILWPLTPMLGDYITSSEANPGTFTLSTDTKLKSYYCVSWQQFWMLILHSPMLGWLQPLIQVLGIIFIAIDIGAGTITGTDINAGDYYHCHWHQHWGLFYFYFLGTTFYFSMPTFCTHQPVFCILPDPFKVPSYLL